MYKKSLLAISFVGVVLGSPLKDEYPTVDFVRSMDLSCIQDAGKRPIKFVAPDKCVEIMKEVKALYDKNIDYMKRPEKDPIIPKVIHQIWLGPKEPPAVFKESKESILKYHPDWEYKLWTDKDVEGFGLQNQELYDRSNNYGERSDILRYEILYRYGGLYLDVDFIAVKPFDVLNHSYRFYSGLYGNYCQCMMGNCLIGTVPGHPIMKNAIDRLGKDWDFYNAKHMSKIPLVVHRSGPMHFYWSFLDGIKQDSDRVIGFPASYFFPHSYVVSLRRKPNDHETGVKPESFAIHCWSGSWKNAHAPASGG